MSRPACVSVSCLVFGYYSLAVLQFLCLPHLGSHLQSWLHLLCRCESDFATTLSRTTWCVTFTSAKSCTSVCSPVWISSLLVPRCGVPSRPVHGKSERQCLLAGAIWRSPCVFRICSITRLTKQGSRSLHDSSQSQVEVSRRHSQLFDHEFDSSMFCLLWRTLSYWCFQQQTIGGVKLRRFSSHGLALTDQRRMQLSEHQGPIAFASGSVCACFAFVRSRD